MESVRTSVKEKNKRPREKPLFIPTLITRCDDCNGVFKTGKRETAEP